MSSDEDDSTDTLEIAEIEEELPPLLSITEERARTAHTRLQQHISLLQRRPDWVFAPVRYCKFPCGTGLYGYCLAAGVCEPIYFHQSRSCNGADIPLRGNVLGGPVVRAVDGHLMYQRWFVVPPDITLK